LKTGENEDIWGVLKLKFVCWEFCESLFTFCCPKTFCAATFLGSYHFKNMGKQQCGCSLEI